MAGTLALVSASPNGLKYTFTSGGAASQAASRTALQMLADAQSATQGPSALAALLVAFGLAGSVDADWAALPQTSKLEVYITGKTIGAAGAAIGVAFSGAGVAEAMVVTELGSTLNDVFIVEVKFVNSVDR